jgi:hypothetical protein
MAPETARDARKIAQADVVASAKRFDAADRSRFRRPKDVVPLPGCFVAKGLKTGWFPSPLLLASERMSSHHFDQINRS